MGLNIAVRGMHERIGSYTTFDNWKWHVSGAADTIFDPPIFNMIMDHSDCDGEYTVEQLPALLEELEIVKSLGVNTDDITDKMIRLCEYGIEIEEPMIFF